MANQTLICCVSPSSISLPEAGGADHGAATSLSEAFIRTDVSQFTPGVSRNTDRQDWAGWICQGVRLLRAGSHNEYVFHKDPNQLMHNMGVVLLPGRVEGETGAYLEVAKQRLGTVLRNYTNSGHIIFDVH